MKKLISLFLTVIMIAALLPAAIPAANALTPTSSWAKGADGKWHISDGNDLLAFAEKLNGGYNFADDEIVLDGDVVFNDRTAAEMKADGSGLNVWPMDVAYGGSSDFRGTFNGAGHSIRGLYRAGADNCAFLYWIGNGGKIENVSFEETYFNAANFTGGIAVATNGGTSTFENVRVNGIIETTGDKCGGFVASVHTGTNTCVFTSCSFNGSVSGRDFVGGYVGLVNNYGDSLSFEDCVSSGSVSGRNLVGGYVGCTLAGAVSADFDASENRCAVNGTNYVGGFVGDVDGANSAAEFEDCMNAGPVASTENFIGGYIGHITSSGTVVSFTDCINAGELRGNVVAGGFVGKNNSSCSISATRCVNTGSILSNDTTYDAGFAGFSNSGTVNFVSCYNLSGSAAIDAIGPDGSASVTGTVSGVSFTGLTSLAGTLNSAGGNWGYRMICVPACFTEADGNLHIGTVEELQAFAAQLAAGNTFAGKTIELDNDVFFNDKTAAQMKLDAAGLNVWSVNASDAGFAGTFDGNSHGIYGLYASSTGNLGFVYTVNGGRFENVNFIEAYFKGGHYVGVVAVVTSSDAEFENVSVDGIIEAASTSYGDYYGGFVATLRSDAAFTSCSFNGSVNGKNDVGGFIGIIETSGSSLSFDSCTNNGEVNAAAANVGGFIGLVNTAFDIDFDSCLNAGAVSSSQLYGSVNAGGFIGRLKDGALEFVSCMNEGSVSANQVVGGFVGEVKGSCTTLFTDSLNAGALTTVNSGYIMGGFVGQYDGTETVTVTRCVNMGIIRSNQPVYDGGFTCYVGDGAVTFDNFFNLDGSAGGSDGMALGSAAVTGTPVVINESDLYALADALGSNWGHKFAEGSIISVPAYFADDFTVDAYKASDTAPTETGKVFAGWFNTDGTVFTGTSGTAVAKFVDEKIMTVKAQERADGDTYRIRFVSTVDCLEYENVGFEISINGGAVKISTSTKVYSSLMADGVSRDAVYVSGCSDSGYITYCALKGIPNDVTGASISVKAFWTTSDGTRVYGAEKLYNLTTTASSITLTVA